MAGDFTPENLEKARLWKRLSVTFGDDGADKLAKALSQSVLTVCQMATDRLKLMPAVHGEFTLHDDTHLLRVTELMAKVMPEKVLEEVLNPVEIALLILAAHFHDVGMIPDADEADRIRRSDEYELARQNWILEYPSFKAALRTKNDPEADPADRTRAESIALDFEGAFFGRFLRDSHAQRSADFVKDRLGKDEHLRIGSGHLAEPLALLCASHNWPPEQITTAAGFHCDKAVGSYFVNMPYLAMVLRLADILDFDRERTPDELFRCINFTNPVSIQEWEKHRQVDGWKIDRDAVRFECACERPEYEHAIRRFLRFIDNELAAAHDLVRRFPKTVAQYALDLPSRTDSSRIHAKEGAYIYAADLEIGLNRDEIIRLLMTEKLYGYPSLAIRELLQNAWDALRHRKAIVKRDDGMDWTLGEVKFEHGVDDQGHEFVRCEDNGVGMDQRIIREFLVRAGRSYYRSPEFERERLTFARVNADFDPCARFGIGFMSLFMLGDRITIATRRYRGSRLGVGDPLIVEINGVGGLIVLRKGPDDQPAGTTIAVTGRRKPERFGIWKDQVRLTDTLFAYAVAGEFPVHGKCSIPEIKDDVEIPREMAEPWHPLTKFKVKNCEMFEQDFSEIDSRLRGKVICGVPLEENGRLAVKTAEAGWVQGEARRGADFWVAAAEKFQIFDREGRTCIDGILVAGPQGRGQRGMPIVGSQPRNPISFGEDMFVLDVRGDLKPELSPDRSPPTRTSVLDDAGPTWRRLNRIAAKAHTRLWEKVFRRFNGREDAKALWQLMALHHVRLSSMRRQMLWEMLWIPTLEADGTLSFRRFSEIGRIPFGPNSAQPFAAEEDGRRVGIDGEMLKWQNVNDYKLVPPVLRQTVISMGTLALHENSPVLEFYQPQDPEEIGFANIMLDRFAKTIPTMLLGRGFEGVLGVGASERVLNKGHAVTAYLLSKQDTALDEPEFSYLHSLAGALVEPGSLEAMAGQDFKNEHFNWHFSTLGYFFRNLDLSKLAPALRPPYRCWLPDGGFFEITEPTLTELAKIQAIDWHRRYRERRE